MVLSDDLLQSSYHAGLLADLVSHLLALLVELSIVRDQPSDLGR